MDIGDFVLVALAGLAAGAVNAAAGGGTLISFPALLAVGLSPVTANVTSSVGLVAGYVGGTIGYRQELRERRVEMTRFAAPALLGGVAGALLLLTLPPGLFEAIVPYLVIVACLLLGIQSRVAQMVRRTGESTHPGARPPGRVASGLTYVSIFAACVYGSYFGAGLGVILLAVLGVFCHSYDFQVLNGLKAFISSLVALTGTAMFIVLGNVAWPMAVTLLVTSFAGGLAGARVARRIRPELLRQAVIVCGLVLAVVLLVRS